MGTGRFIVDGMPRSDQIRSVDSLSAEVLRRSVQTTVLPERLDDSPTMPPTDTLLSTEQYKQPAHGETSISEPRTPPKLRRSIVAASASSTSLQEWFNIPETWSEPARVTSYPPAHLLTRASPPSCAHGLNQWTCFNFEFRILTPRPRNLSYLRGCTHRSQQKQEHGWRLPDRCVFRDAA